MKWEVGTYEERKKESLQHWRFNPYCHLLWTGCSVEKPSGYELQEMLVLYPYHHGCHICASVRIPMKSSTASDRLCSRCTMPWSMYQQLVTMTVSEWLVLRWSQTFLKAWISHWWGGQTVVVGPLHPLLPAGKLVPTFMKRIGINKHWVFKIHGIISHTCP